MILSKNIKYIELPISKVLNENSNFMSNKILTKIKKIIKYKYTLHNKTHLWAYNINDKMIIKILEIIDFLRDLMNNKLEYFIYLYGFSDKKKLPTKKEKKLTANEINSGLTYWSNNNMNKNGISIIYRKEELIKVIIHECIHAFGFDYNSCLEVHGVKNPFEAVNESIATIITWYINDSNNQIIEKQFKHNAKNAKKILDFYNLKDEFEPINEETNIKSYYLLKAKIMNNGHSSKLLNMAISYKWKLCDIPNINKIINDIWKEPLQLLDYDKNDKTLKMTVFD